MINDRGEFVWDTEDWLMLCLLVLILVMGLSRWKCEGFQTHDERQHLQNMEMRRLELEFKAKERQ